MNKSKCCQSEMKVISADEGTSFDVKYECLECKLPCYFYVNDFTTKKLEEFEKEYASSDGYDYINGGTRISEIKSFLSTSIQQALAEDRKRVVGEIRKRRDSLSMSTKFAVMMMNQRGDAGKMVKELRELGGYQAIDELLSSLDKPKE